MTDQNFPAGAVRMTTTAVFIVIALALIGGGYAYYRVETESIRRERYQHLRTVSEMKAAEIVAWRRARLADVGRLAQGPFLMTGIADLVRNPGDTELQANMRRRFELEQQAYGYADVLLFDPQGRVLASLSGGPAGPLHAEARGTLEAAFESGNAVLSDLYRDVSGAIFIDAAAPVRDAAGRSLAVVALRSDAADQFLPTVQSWPVPSQSMEVLLVRREADEVVLSSMLRHRPDPPLAVRFPLSRLDIPAVRAVLGDEGLFDGMDYRDVRVLAHLQAIPDTPWRLVAKIDTSEILAEVRYRAMMIGLVVFFGILLAATLTSYAFRLRQARAYRALYRSEQAAQRALHESERTLSTLMDNLPGMVYRCRLDTDWTMLFVSEGALDVTGYRPAELVGNAHLAYADLIHPGDRERVWDTIERAVQESRPFTLEYRIIHESGEERWVWERGRAIVADGERKPTLEGFITGITGRKQAEEQLHLQGAALEAAANAIFITDRDGIIAWVNPAFTALSGYTAAEAIGKNPRELIKSGAHDEAFYKDLWNTVLDGRVWHGELTNRRKDGSLYTEEQTIAPVRDAQGEIRHFVGIKQDITERKQAEEARELLEGQLRQAQKMEAVGRLAGGVAHDFNNMLGVILGRTELAMMSLEPDSPVRADLLEVQAAAERSAELVRQLLGFARKQVVAPRVLDLNDTVSGMLKMLGRLIGEDIHLAWIPCHGLWPVKMDPGQVNQILANLVVNARDAIEGVGKVTIETGNVTFNEEYCRTHAGFRPGEYVLLAVSDDGCGMDRETIEQLFEPFFTTKALGQGTGLGLATVYGVVKQSNGFINVYSEPGQGATFRIYFPRHAGEEDGPAVAHEPAEVRGGSETVLLVEDENALRELARRMLDDLGYRVITAESPAAALQAAREYPEEIHLLMTDVVMPGMNGRELERKLKVLRPALKCLFMSGYTANVIAHHGILEAGVHYLQKPFSREALAARLREALG